jgi:hypothetical protein
VCTIASELVQMTVAPAATSIRSGRNVISRILALTTVFLPASAGVTRAARGAARDALSGEERTLSDLARPLAESTATGCRALSRVTKGAAAALGG